MIWEASDRICGKRLRPLVPDPGRGDGAAWPSQPRAGGAHRPAGDERGDDRPRACERSGSKRAGRRAGKRLPSAAIRRSVPVRTFDGWDDPPPGFVEADLVAHSGPVAKGSFVQTLVLTDIATGWTECAPLLVREQRLLTEVLERNAQAAAVRPARVRHGQRQRVHERDRAGLLPRRRASSSRAAGPIARTTRPGSSRRTARWCAGPSATGASRAWKPRRCWRGCTRALRLFVNFFQPSFKLADEGARRGKGDEALSSAGHAL